MIQMQIPHHDNNDMKLPFKLFLYGLLALSLPALGQTINWTGGGDGVSWNSPLNWSGGAVPGMTNDVVINVASNVSIVCASGATVKSIQCTGGFSLAGGTLTVTAGPSTISGLLNAASGATLSAVGTGVTFTANGAAQI